MISSARIPFTLSLCALGAALSLAACSKQEAAPAAGAASGSASASATTAAAGAVEVLIGTVGPMSGGIAHVGKDVENGVRMAIDEINASQPVIGGKPVHFKLIAEDDAGDPRQATTVAQKMCDAQVAGVVGHLQSGTTIPAADVYHRCGIPHVTPAATNPDVTKAGYNTTFRVIANDNQLAEAVAASAAQQGVKTVAVIDDRTAFGQGLADTFEEAAKQNGMQVLVREFTNDKATDFMPILTAIKARNPDAIMFGGLDAQGGPMLRQMQQLGMSQVRLLGGDPLCTERMPELSGNSPTVENVICATGGISVQRMQGGQDWLQRYEKAYSGQFQIYSPYTYDATQVLVAAMKQADSTDPQVYLPKLAALQYQGLTGDISFTPSGELQKPAVTLYRFQGGKRVEQ